MTALCSICKELIVSPSVPLVSPNRDKLEFVAFSKEAMKHLSRRHHEMARSFALVFDLLASYLAMLTVESNDPTFEERRNWLRDEVLSTIRGVELVRKTTQLNAVES